MNNKQTRVDADAQTADQAQRQAEEARQAREAQEAQRKDEANKAQGDESSSRPYTYAEAIADAANKTGIKPGDIIDQGDPRTVTMPEAAVNAVVGPFAPEAMANLQPDIPPVRESQKEKFDRTIEEVSRLLSRQPSAMTVDLVKEGGVHKYMFNDNSNDGRGARDQARKALKDLYQSGAYSYSQFAERLRLTNKDVQALLDDDWREQQGIV